MTAKKTEPRLRGEGSGLAGGDSRVEEEELEGGDVAGARKRRRKEVRRSEP